MLDGDVLDGSCRDASLAAVKRAQRRLRASQSQNNLMRDPRDPRPVGGSRSQGALGGLDEEEAGHEASAAAGRHASRIR